MVQIHLGQPNMQFDIIDTHNFYANGNKYKFVGGAEEFIAHGFKGRWNDDELKYKENISYFKLKKLNVNDEFVITSLNTPNYLKWDWVPEQVALFCPKRNFSFLIESPVFKVHYTYNKDKRKRYCVIKRSKKITTTWSLGNKVYDPLFCWIAGPDLKNYNDLWNKINEYL